MDTPASDLRDSDDQVTAESAIIPSELISTQVKTMRMPLANCEFAGQTDICGGPFLQQRQK